MARELLLPWDSQPLGEVLEIDWNNPLTRGLISASCGSITIDRNGRVGGFGSQSGVDRGIVYGSAYAGNGQQTLYTGSTLTIVAGIYYASYPGAWFSMLNVGYYVSSTDRFSFGLTASSIATNLILTATYNNSALNVVGNTEFAVTYPYRKHLRIQLSNWTTVSLFENGGSTATQTTAPVGSVAEDNRRAFRGYNTKYSFVYNRNISVAEDRSLQSNPWQIFKPRKIPTSGTNAVTVVATTSIQDASSTTNAISQHHNVTASTTTQNADSSTNYIGSEGFFLGGSTTQNSSSSTNVITLIQTLTGDSTVQTATSELDTVTSIHIVVAAPANQTANSSTDAIQQVHFVSSAASSQSSNANVGAITLAQTLAGDSCTQNAYCITGFIDQAHTVTAAFTTQDANSGTGIYTSTQLLSADPATQTATSTSDSIVHIHILLASNSTQAANDSVFAITQDHELVSSTDIQYNNSSTDAAEIGLYVLADSSNQTATSSTNVITLIQLLVAADSISTAISTESGITQVHILLATPSYEDNYSDSNVIVNIHNLTVAADIQLNQSTAEALLANAYREGYYISSEVKSVVIVSKNGDTFVISNPSYGIVTTTNNAVIVASNDVSIEYYKFNKAA